jgi:hypothetical protein
MNLLLFQSTYVLSTKIAGEMGSKARICYGGKENTFRANGRYETENCERKREALGKDAHSVYTVHVLV